MTLIDKLAQDVLNDSYFKTLFYRSAILSAEYNLNKTISNDLTEKELKDTLRFANILSNSPKPICRNSAYQLITFLNVKYNNNPFYRTVSKAVYSQLGNFPAIEYLEKHNDNFAQLPLLEDIAIDIKKSIQSVPDTKNLIFTDSQYELFTKMSNTLEFSFSGPTSMGKSFIIKSFIRKIIKNSPPENIVIIVPTRALINQFSIDLKTDLLKLFEQYKYKIFTNSNVSDIITEEKHNYIFVLTPERLLSYLSQSNNPPIGFIFVDEAHKLANKNDSRSVTTYTAIEKTLKKYGNIKIYFSSPNVSNPEIFLNLFNRGTGKNYYKTDESPVTQHLFLIDLLTKSITLYQVNEQIDIPARRFLHPVKTISDLILLIGKNKNNLIYCNSKLKTIERAYNLAQQLPKDISTPELKNAINQIKEYIHPDYYLAELLEHKTAYHYGRLPQLIRNLVEDLYKSEKINNVFCTSTLLEGVNMPTQNIFILDNKNGRKNLEPIDFWNLSGRAGRLSRELSGNIFCIQHEDCDWENKDMLKQSDINLNATVINKIDRNLRKIEKLLNGKDISGTQEEQFILKYIANIISVDTYEIDSKYKSPLINKLIEKNKEIIIELAKQRIVDFEIPNYILGGNQSIDLNVQNDVFKTLFKKYKNNIDIKLPGSNSINYDTCFDTLNMMYDLYNWNNAEKKLQNINSMKYYAVLMNQWINGFPLNSIIKSTLDWKSKNGGTVRINYKEPVEFSIENKLHINYVIETLIDDIEYVLRFLFEKYFNHHFQIISEILSEEKAGENWASLLEYGTQNRIVIALQNIGLSRSTALKIYEKYRVTLTIREGKLIKVDKNHLLQLINKDSLEYSEIMKVL